jgi:hypothetical protein
VRRVVICDKQATKHVQFAIALPARCPAGWSSPVEIGLHASHQVHMLASADVRWWRGACTIPRSSTQTRALVALATTSFLQGTDTRQSMQSMSICCDVEDPVLHSPDSRGCLIACCITACPATPCMCRTPQGTSTCLIKWRYQSWRLPRCAMRRHRAECTSISLLPQLVQLACWCQPACVQQTVDG